MFPAIRSSDPDLLLALNFVAYAATMAQSYGLTAIDKADYTFYANLIGLAAQIAVSILLVRMFHVPGAAAAFADRQCDRDGRTPAVLYPHRCDRAARAGDAIGMSVLTPTRPAAANRAQRLCCHRARIALACAGTKSSAASRWASASRFPCHTNFRTCRARSRAVAAAVESQAYAGSISRQIAMPILLCIGLYMLWRLPRRGNMRGRLMVLALMYVGWAALSLAWSVDPSITGKRLVVFAIDAFTAFVIARTLSMIRRWRCSASSPLSASRADCTLCGDRQARRTLRPSIPSTASWALTTRQLHGYEPSRLRLLRAHAH